MDIKDFILIGGGLLIAMVIGHGFWIAWRAKREPLRLDIVPDLIPDSVDEIERLRGELPNGGARIVPRRPMAEEQVNLPLDFAESPPLLITPTSEKSTTPSPDVAANEPIEAAEPCESKSKPKVHQAPPRVSGEASRPVEPELTTTRRNVSQRNKAADAQAPVKPHVREVSLHTQERQRSRKRAESENAASSSADLGAVEELLVVNVLAPRGESFDGERLVNALRNQGLRYGEMNIFHRVDTATKAKLYGVANAVEPGTFDLSDLEALHSPGMTFFLQLPGPLDATDMFDDMLETARNIAVELGAELRDEAMSGLTGQTVEHMRQRIADYSRRRLSKRA
ncbi:MAG: cell division protein ZipA [Pseudomonadaceae bacterium]|nr:cell division protein ZipA [Pseudomonadaceae bacterium]